MDTPAPPPEDARPGAATLLTVSASDLAALIGDLAACAVVSHAALAALAKVLEQMANDCREDAEEDRPSHKSLAKGLESARNALNIPGLLNERECNGLRALEKTICAAVKETEGKPMKSPGAQLIESLPDDAEELIQTVKGKLATRALYLKMTAAPLAPPPPFKDRNGASWSASPWNPENN
jgi:hypothetical protein